MSLFANCQLFGNLINDMFMVMTCHLASSVSEIMIIKTRVFESCNGNYSNLSELAQSMGMSVSQIYRVRESKRRLSEKFIIGLSE